MPNSNQDEWRRWQKLVEALAEASGGVKPRKQTPETGERAMDLMKDVGIVENAEIREIPSLLPAPTPTAIEVRANWGHFTPKRVFLILTVGGASDWLCECVHLFFGQWVNSVFRCGWGPELLRCVPSCLLTSCVLLCP